jgi:hypothetical protein
MLGDQGQHARESNQIIENCAVIEPKRLLSP